VEWGNIKILGLSWLKVSIVQFKVAPSDFAHRDQRLSGWKYHFATLSSTTSVSDRIAAMTSNRRLFKSTFAFIPRCDIRQDVSALFFFAQSCMVLHTESQICLLSPFRTAHKFPSNLPNV